MRGSYLGLPIPQRLPVEEGVIQSNAGIQVAGVFLSLAPLPHLRTYSSRKSLLRTYTCIYTHASRCAHTLEYTHVIICTHKNLTHMQACICVCKFPYARQAHLHHIVSTDRCTHSYTQGRYGKVHTHMHTQGFPATEEARDMERCTVLPRRSRFPEGVPHIFIPTETRVRCSRPRFRPPQGKVSLRVVPGPRMSGRLKTD